MRRHDIAALSMCIAAATAPLSAGCGGGEEPEEPTPAEAGPCSFQIEGDTTDSVEEKTSVTFRDLVLYMSCERREAGVAESRLSIKLRSYNGAHEYPIDRTDRYGELNYAGNDGILYSTFASDDATTGCAVDVVQGRPNPAPGDPFEATFTCQRLRGLAGGSTSQHVDLLAGSMKGSFPAAP